MPISKIEEKTEKFKPTVIEVLTKDWTEVKLLKWQTDGSLRKSVISQLKGFALRYGVKFESIDILDGEDEFYSLQSKILKEIYNRLEKREQMEIDLEKTRYGAMDFGEEGMPNE